MTYTNSPLATNFVDVSKNSNPRQNSQYNPSGAITVITIHHMAGIMTSVACAQMHANKNSSSANYYIGYDGDICLGVPESRRAWTTGSATNDYKAITIEVSNNSGAPNWTVSDASYQATIKLCADICQRNNIARIIYTGNKSGNLTMHKWFQATACPGPYLEPRFPDIADKINQILSGVTPTPQPTPTPATYPATPFTITTTSAYIYSKPDINYNTKKETGKGTFTIVEVSGDFGRLKSGAGWVWLQDPSVKIDGTVAATPKPAPTQSQAPAKTPYIIKVTVPALNYRSGPGITYKLKGVIRDQGRYTIVEEKNGWGKLKSGAGWICLQYTKKV